MKNHRIPFPEIDGPTDLYKVQTERVDIVKEKISEVVEKLFEALDSGKVSDILRIQEDLQFELAQIFISCLSALLETEDPEEEMRKASQSYLSHILFEKMYPCIDAMMADKNNIIKAQEQYKKGPN